MGSFPCRWFFIVINTNYVVIVLCPFCGNKLSQKLRDGITTCDHCGRIFTSNSTTKILSAAWNVRNWHVQDPETLRKQCELTDEELALVSEYVVANQLTHDEFIRVCSNF